MEKIYIFVRFDIAEGRTEDFIATAGLSHQAVLPDLAGTHAYEWYMSRDGRQVWVIEIYDDLAAISRHTQMVGDLPERIVEPSSFAMTVGGAVPDEMLAGLRARLGHVGYCGRNHQGPRRGVAERRHVKDNPHQVCCLSWIAPFPGKHGALRELAAADLELTRASDALDPASEWFFDDEGNAVILTILPDAAALADHLEQHASVLRGLQAVSETRTVIMGELSPALTDVVQQDAAITLFPRRLHGVN